MQLFALFLFFKQKGRGWGGGNQLAHAYIRAKPTLLPPIVPLFSSQKSSWIASYSLPIEFGPETTPFIWSMKNGLVGAINNTFFLTKADKLIVNIFYFQFCFLNSCFEFVNPISYLVALNEPYYLFLKDFKGHSQGGGSFGDSLRIFRVKLNSLPMTYNPNTYHSSPLSYSSLVIL